MLLEVNAFVTSLGLEEQVQSDHPSRDQKPRDDYRVPITTYFASRLIFLRVEEVVGQHWKSVRGKGDRPAGNLLGSHVDDREKRRRQVKVRDVRFPVFMYVSRFTVSNRS